MVKATSELRFRNFIFVWLSQALSVFGSSIMFFAINIWMVQVVFPDPAQKGQLAAALSGSALAFTLPLVLLSPLAGVIADRYSRKHIMILCDVLSFAVAFFVAYLMFLGTLSIATYLVLGVLIASVATFHAAAYQTMTQLLTPPEQLQRANGLMQAIWPVANVLSPAIAALLILVPGLYGWGNEKLGAALAISLDSLTFLVAAIALLFIPVLDHREGQPTSARTPLIQDLTFGWRFITGRPRLVGLLSTIATGNFFLAPLVVLIPLLAKYQYAAGEDDYTALYASFNTFLAVGGVLGGVVAMSWISKKYQGLRTVAVLVTLSGVFLTTLGLTPYPIIALIGILMIALLGPVYGSKSQYLWQSSVPIELQGRVFSVRRTISQGLNPVSISITGFLVAHFAVRHVVMVYGLCLIVSTALIYRAARNAARLEGSGGFAELEQG